MARNQLQVAIVGASTLLGKELLDGISDSSASVWDLRVLEEGEAFSGQLTSAGDEALVTHSLDEAALEGVDLVFFAATPQITRKYLNAATRAGAAVVDLTGATYGDPDFVVRSVWVEGNARPDLTTAGITVPHPAALMLASVLSKLQHLNGFTHVSATVLEPASQAGAAGVDELHQQTIKLLSFQELPTTTFGGQVAFNMQATLPEEAQVDLGEVRRRLYADLDRLLSAEVARAVTCSLLQAPVFHGYMISAHVSMTGAVDLERIRTAISGGHIQSDDAVVPSNQAATESGNLLVSVGEDPRSAQGCWLLLAADNLRLVAQSAVQSGLELAALRPGSRVQ